MEAADRKGYARLIYAKAMRYFSLALVGCALAAGVLGMRVYFLFALCAAGLSVPGMELVYPPACHRLFPRGRLEGEKAAQARALYAQARQDEALPPLLRHAQYGL